MFAVAFFQLYYRGSFFKLGGKVFPHFIYLFFNIKLIVNL